MAPVERRLATFADLADRRDDKRLEIVHGMIVEKAAPSGEHGAVQLRVSMSLGPPFDRGRGGPRGPGGWWLGSEVDVEYATHEIFRHDLVGWRRDRVPERPSGIPVRIRPDWACEILSESNAKRDLVDKFLVLQRAGVPHYWIVDGDEKQLLVWRLEGAGYHLIRTAHAGERFRAEPFDAVELRLDVLLGDADDDD